MIIALFALIFAEKQLSRYSVRKLSRAIARNPPNESPRFSLSPTVTPLHAPMPGLTGTLPCLAVPGRAGQAVVHFAGRFACFKSSCASGVKGSCRC